MHKKLFKSKTDHLVQHQDSESADNPSQIMSRKLGLHLAVTSKQLTLLATEAWVSTKVSTSTASSKQVKLPSALDLHT